MVDPLHQNVTVIQRTSVGRNKELPPCLETSSINRKGGTERQDKKEGGISGEIVKENTKPLMANRGW